MQNFIFTAEKKKGAHTPFTAPYFAFVRLGRVFTRFGVQGIFCGCFGRGESLLSYFFFLL